MKIVVNQFKMDLSFFLSIQSVISQYSDKGLAQNKRRAILGINDGLFTGAYMHL